MLFRSFSQYAARMSYPAACTAGGHVSEHNDANTGLMIARRGIGDWVARTAARVRACPSDGTAGGDSSSTSVSNGSVCTGVASDAEEDGTAAEGVGASGALRRQTNCGKALVFARRRGGRWVSSFCDGIAQWLGYSVAEKRSQRGPYGESDTREYLGKGSYRGRIVLS